MIFTSQRSDSDDGYAAMAERMVELAQNQPGFLGAESVRDAQGLGLTVSYWTDEAAIVSWKAVAEHQVAQKLGRETWYTGFRLRVAKVERDYGF